MAVDEVPGYFPTGGGRLVCIRRGASSGEALTVRARRGPAMSGSLSAEIEGV